MARGSHALTLHIALEAHLSTCLPPSAPNRLPQVLLPSSEPTEHPFTVFLATVTAVCCHFLVDVSVPEGQMLSYSPWSLLIHVWLGSDKVLDE